LAVPEKSFGALKTAFFDLKPSLSVDKFLGVCLSNISKPVEAA
jgi:hypothetical protein